MNNTIFAERLKEARTAAKLTQSELSKKADVAAATISAYESADGTKGKNPSLDNAQKLANALNVSLDWLSGRVSTNENNTKAFLLCFIQLFESLDYHEIDKLTGKLKSSFDGISIEVYKPIFSNNQDKHLLYHFTKDYLEVLPVIRKGLLPPDIQQTVINKIIDDYANIPINELISDGFMIEGA